MPAPAKDQVSRPSSGRKEQIDEFRAGKEPTGEFVAEWQYGDLDKGFADAKVDHRRTIS